MKQDWRRCDFIFHTKDTKKGGKTKIKRECYCQKKMYSPVSIDLNIFLLLNKKKKSY